MFEAGEASRIVASEVRVTDRDRDAFGGEPSGGAGNLSFPNSKFGTKPSSLIADTPDTGLSSAVTDPGVGRETAGTGVTTAGEVGWGRLK